MSKRIYPNWLPRLSNPVVMDAAGDLRQLRGDYDGSLFGGYTGGFHAVVRERVTTQFPAGGDVYVTSTAVPSGYRHVIQVCEGHHLDPTARRCSLQLLYSGSIVHLVHAGALPYGNSLLAPTEVVLEAGEQVRMTVDALVAGGVVYISLAGYAVQL